MAWIRTVGADEAEGLLARLYREAVARAGKVFGVLRVQSLQPRVLETSTELYRRVMFGASEPLTRAQREMIAVTVSRANGCEY